MRAAPRDHARAPGSPPTGQTCLTPRDSILPPTYLLVRLDQRFAIDPRLPSLRHFAMQRVTSLEPRTPHQPGKLQKLSKNDFVFTPFIFRVNKKPVLLSSAKSMECRPSTSGCRVNCATRKEITHVSLIGYTFWDHFSSSRTNGSKDPNLSIVKIPAGTLLEAGSEPVVLCVLCALCGKSCRHLPRRRRDRVECPFPAGGKLKTRRKLEQPDGSITKNSQPGTENWCNDSRQIPD